MIATSLLCQLAKKLFLVGFAVLITPGSLMQLVAATAVSLFLLPMQMAAAPFVHPSDNYLAVATSLVVVVVFFLCVLLKVRVYSHERAHACR